MHMAIYSKKTNIFTTMVGNIMYWTNGMEEHMFVVRFLVLFLHRRQSEMASMELLNFEI